MKSATNLFHNPQSAYSSKVLNYDGRCLFNHRDVEVFKNPRGSWDYIFAGAVITQRAGFSAARAKELIDDILDGREYRSDAVADHLEAHGFTVLRYSEVGS